ncbi:cation:proton antiporter [Candidatus Acetothermia bacterium]|nr:cation:proton antiporter [Candidatus Acetothermia bacterium]MBI3460439.1 cation:proton antiporter [Candidatus Acetothermia bacterium]
MELYVGMVLAALIFFASLISVELGLSAAIIEITLGVIGGNFLGLQQLDWVKYIASFGGILLTFMAGAEVDLRVMREKAKESFTIGALSFFAPFLGTMLICYFALHWDWRAAQLAGIALSTTSLAVVYAVLVETGLTHTQIGKIIMASTFVTDFGTSAGLSLLFITPDVNTLWFALVSIAIIALAPFVAPFFFKRYGSRVIEPEIKLLFLLLLVLMYFAQVGSSHAILPAFVLGLVMSPLFHGNRELQRKLRIVAFAFVTPIFFLNGGMNISLPLLWVNIGLFGILLAIKLVTKFVGVYPVSKIFIPREATYTTLLMSTGLTMGTISSVFGYQNGIINQSQFSVLVAVVVASAIIPTFFAQRFFHPHHAFEAIGSEVEPELVEATKPASPQTTGRR